MSYEPVEHMLPAVIKERPAPAPRRFVPGKSPIVPPGSVTGRSLMLVIAIMSFLASLTSGAVYMVNQSASAWLRDISSEITVQVKRGAPNEDVEARLAAIAKMLETQPGVAQASPLSKQQSDELIEPWLGHIDVLGTLPIPGLISVQIDRDRPPELEALQKTVSAKFPGVTIDDHRQWQMQIRSVTRSLALGGVAVIILVAAATVGIIVSATQSAMTSNREIIEVLNFVGAGEFFIANQFEMHFLKLGIKAGAAGATLAALLFFCAPYVAEFVGGSMAADTEVHRVFGSGALDMFGYVTLFFVVAAVAAICRLTSRYGVRHILEVQNL
jgi:cell division transport system permease protein